jgi:hypothetical protein
LAVVPSSAIRTCLFYLAQADEFPWGYHTGLFFEFTPRRRQEFFTRRDFALRNRPGLDLFLTPKWATRVNKEHFEGALPSSKQR